MAWRRVKEAQISGKCKRRFWAASRGKRQKEEEKLHPKGRQTQQKVTVACGDCEGCLYGKIRTRGVAQQ